MCICIYLFYKISKIYTYSNITIILYTIINRWQNVIKFHCTYVPEYLKHFLATHVRAGTKKDRCMMQVNETNTREQDTLYFLLVHLRGIYLPRLSRGVFSFICMSSDNVSGHNNRISDFGRAVVPRLASRHRSINVIIFIYFATSR